MNYFILLNFFFVSQTVSDIIIEFYFEEFWPMKRQIKPDKLKVIKFYISSRKHAYIILTPLNLTFI